MSNNKFINTDLVCLECGNISSITVLPTALKKVPSLNDFWCYKCKNYTKHYNVHDVSKFMFRSGNDMDNYVKELIVNGHKDNEKRDRVFAKILKK